MDYTTLIISFVVLMIIFISFSAFILNRVFVSNTDGAIQRLDQEYASATKKQSELNKRLRQADKAKTATETLRLEMEKEMDSKFIQFSMQILNNILGDHSKGAFNQVLVDEYLEKLKTRKFVFPVEI